MSVQYEFCLVLFGLFCFVGGLYFGYLYLVVFGKVYYLSVNYADHENQIEKKIKKMFKGFEGPPKSKYRHFTMFSYFPSIFLLVFLKFEISAVIFFQNY